MPRILWKQELMELFQGRILEWNTAGELKKDEKNSKPTYTGYHMIQLSQ